MSIYTEYESEFVPCYKGGRCEDAPCCGCGNDYRYLGEYDAPDVDDFYDKWDDYDDSYDEYDESDYESMMEDSAMESALFGDC